MLLSSQHIPSLGVRPGYIPSHAHVPRRAAAILGRSRGCLRSDESDIYSRRIRCDPMAAPEQDTFERSPPQSLHTKTDKWSNKLCESLGCFKRPCYAHEGSRPRVCLLHKEEGMINVNKKCCETPGCSTNPVFAAQGARLPRFCSIHKEADMVNVSSKRCQHAGGCTSIPSYAVEAGGSRRFCLKHREPGMVLVTGRRCLQPGCCIQAFFSKVGGTSYFCRAHKEPEMVNVRLVVCAEPGCIVQASFGEVGRSPLFCSAHKHTGMVRVRSNKKLDTQPRIEMPVLSAAAGAVS